MSLKAELLLRAQFKVAASPSVGESLILMVSIGPLWYPTA